MQKRIVCLFVAFACLVVPANPSAGQVAPHKGGEDLSGPYEPHPNWPKPIDPDRTWGRTGTVFAETPDRIFVMQSGMVSWSWKRLAEPAQGGGTLLASANEATHCASTVMRQANCTPGRDPLAEKSGNVIPGAGWDHVLMVFDGAGNLIESWEQHNDLFTHPHNVTISPYDPERHVWVVDAGSEQIFKFTNDGQLVMTVGEFRVTGSDETHFGNPSGIAFLPNGDFYVSDGYRNTRVVKFSKDGTYLMEWGTPGDGPGEFNVVHGLAIDAEGRVYVIDRSNSRIQVFDLNGTYLDEWPGLNLPLYVAVSEDQHIWVSSGLTNKILKYDRHGQLLYSWGTFGAQPGAIWGVHGFSTDTAGNLYVAEVFAGRVQKLRPRTGANPSFLVGPIASPGSLRPN